MNRALMVEGLVDVWSSHLKVPLRFLTWYACDHHHCMKIHEAKSRDVNTHLFIINKVQLDWNVSSSGDAQNEVHNGDTIMRRLLQHKVLFIRPPRPPSSSSFFLLVLLSLWSEVVVVTNVQIHIEGFSVAVSIRSENVFMKRPVHTDSCSTENSC